MWAIGIGEVCKGIIRSSAFFVALGFMTGCSSIADTAEQLQSLMITEDTDYVVMHERADASQFAHAGDTLADMEVAWSESLSSIEDTTHELSDAIHDASTDDRAKAASEIVILMLQMDAPFTRKINTILWVPSWRYVQVANTVKSTQNNIAKIYTHYSALVAYYPDIPISTRGDEEVAITVKMDTALRDTYPDCVLAYENQDRILDHTCRNAAIANCTHQMDMQCVNTTIRLSVENRSLGQAPCYDTVTSAAGTTVDVAPWLALQNFEACRSPTPVLESPHLLSQ